MVVPNSSAINCVFRRSNAICLAFSKSTFSGTMYVYSPSAFFIC